jgi:hypothetical protein
VVSHPFHDETVERMGHGASPSRRTVITGPQKRGTGGTLNLIWKDHRVRGRPAAKCPSAAKAIVESIGFMRGLKPPPPS